MIINSYIITYLVCSVLALVIGVSMAVTGIPVLANWNFDNSSEEQYRLEKRVYLIITLCSLGFFLRLLMTPLWFMSLHSMIISVPGAMCLVGVHNINAPLSFVASGLKLIVPVLYGYWLVINFLDRQVVTQPFMKQKLMFLIPMGILILTESSLDALFLLSIPPRQVSCCTSLFDIPADGKLIEMVTDVSWIWVIVFYILAFLVIVNILYIMVKKKWHVGPKKGGWYEKKAIMFFESLLPISCFLALVLALHTKISPLFLGLPFHHCIFCLVQDSLITLLSVGMIYTGLGLLLIYFRVASSRGFFQALPVLTNKTLKLLNCSLYLVSGGCVLLSIRLGLAMWGA